MSAVRVLSHKAETQLLTSFQPPKRALAQCCNLIVSLLDTADLRRDKIGWTKILKLPRASFMYADFFSVCRLTFMIAKGIAIHSETGSST